MNSNLPRIRRTFSQERFDILIKKQRNGNATFNDLTELDDIVNRDPAIRESILEEMHERNNPQQPGPGQDEIMFMQPEAPKPQTLLQQLLAFINRLFMVQTHLLKTPLSA